MKCGKCGKNMKKEIQTIFGEKANVFVCNSCGNKMIDIDEAIKLQEKLLPKIHETRKIVSVGTSTAVTIPKKLEKIFQKGDKVRVDFNPKNMELKITKTK